MKKEFKELCRRIEVTIGRKMKTPKDFYFLSEAVWGQIHEKISCSTLMRAWGYAGKTAEARYSTKSVLSRFLGYADWNDYLAEYSVVSEIRSQKLSIGQMMEVCWDPECHCVFRYEGEMRFGVMESDSSYLCVGDTFDCGIFILEEPLLLNNVVHDGMQPISYIAGCKSGLTKLRLIE
ncbi:MAG: hypothetical protein MJ197_00040 [Bacteroidales bacterium]|nr:hypothetical protein [Bacteroidales bacterium]